MDMRAFISFLLILWVFEKAKKNLRFTDLKDLLVIAYKIWTDCARKLKFRIFSLFNAVELWRKCHIFSQICPGEFGWNDPLIIDIIPWDFNLQISFESWVHFSHFSCLKSLPWFLHLSLNGVSEEPRYYCWFC